MIQGRGKLSGTKLTAAEYLFENFIIPKLQHSISLNNISKYLVKLHLFVNSSLIIFFLDVTHLQKYINCTNT